MQKYIEYFVESSDWESLFITDPETIFEFLVLQLAPEDTLMFGFYKRLQDQFYGARDLLMVVLYQLQIDFHAHDVVHFFLQGHQENVGNQRITYTSAYNDINILKSFFSAMS